MARASKISKSVTRLLPTILGAAVVIVLVMAAVAFFRPSREHYASGYKVQMIVKPPVDPAQIAAYDELRKRMSGIDIGQYSTTTPEGKAAIAKFGITTYPDMRVLKDGQNVTKFENRPWTADNLKSWIMGKVPANLGVTYN